MKNHIRIMTEELFQISLTGYLMLLLADTIKEGFVSYFLNLNWLLGVVLISGILMTITSPKDEHKQKEPSRYEWEYVFAVTVLGAAIVYVKTIELGNLAIFIAVLAGVMIALISYLVLKDESILKFTPLPKHLLKQLRGKK